MTDRPIMFSAPMVRKLLEGRKTQTRRVLKLPTKTHSGGPIDEHPKMGGWAVSTIGGHGDHSIGVSRETAAHDRACIWHQTTGCTVVPAYAPGDRLYVREAIDKASDRDGVFYRADYEAQHGDATGLGWRPSIHMPRWASRLTLTVTEVRVQRLQEISAGDSIAEGVECETCTAMGQSACHGRGCFASIDAYRTLWNSLHGPDAWDANPWVVALTFNVKRGNIDQIGGAK